MKWSKLIGKSIELRTTSPAGKNIVDYDKEKSVLLHILYREDVELRTKILLCSDILSGITFYLPYYEELISLMEEIEGKVFSDQVILYMPGKNLEGYLSLLKEQYFGQKGENRKVLLRLIKKSIVAYPALEGVFHDILSASDREFIHFKTYL